MEPAALPAILQAVRDLHGVEPSFVRSESVREEFRGDLVWEGEVHVLALPAGAPAPYCYAWSRAMSGGRRTFHAVLHAPPVDSPSKAVRAAVVAKAKRR